MTAANLDMLAARIDALAQPVALREADEAHPARSVLPPSGRAWAGTYAWLIVWPIVDPTPAFIDTQCAEAERRMDEALKEFTDRNEVIDGYVALALPEPPQRRSGPSCGVPNWEPGSVGSMWCGGTAKIGRRWTRSRLWGCPAQMAAASGPHSPRFLRIRKHWRNGCAPTGSRSSRSIFAMPGSTRPERRRNNDRPQSELAPP